MAETDPKTIDLETGQGSHSPGSANHAAGDALSAGHDRRSGSWLRLGPNVTLTILVLIAALFGLTLLHLEMANRIPFGMICILFVWMVWRRSSFALACLFIVLAWVVITTSFHQPWGVRFRPEEIFARDITAALLLLVFAGACFRFLETRKYSFGVLSKFGWNRGRSNKKDPGREFPSLFGGRWWLIPIAVAVAVVLLGMFPVDHTVVQKFWVQTKPMRLIFLIGTLFLVWFVARSLFMLIMRWKMDSDQAGVHTRAVIASEFWREHRAIESRRAKAMQKKSLRS